MLRINYLILAFLFPAFAQFISEPLPFDTADLYVPPMGTSVVSFGDGLLPTDTAIQAFLTGTATSSLTVVTTSATTAPSAIVEASAAIASTDTRSIVETRPPTTTSSTIIAPPGTSSDSTTEIIPPTKTISTTIGVLQQSSHSSKNNIPYTEGNVVVTIMDTLYTTVSCSSTTTELSKPSLQTGSVSTQNSISSSTAKPPAIQAIVESTVIPALSTSPSAMSTGLHSEAFPTKSTSECPDWTFTLYKTRVSFTTVTQVTTAVVTESNFITLSS